MIRATIVRLEVSLTKEKFCVDNGLRTICRKVVITNFTIENAVRRI